MNKTAKRVAITFGALGALVGGVVVATKLKPKSPRGATPIEIFRSYTTRGAAPPLHIAQYAIMEALLNGDRALADRFAGLYLLTTQSDWNMNGTPGSLANVRAIHGHAPSAERQLGIDDQAWQMFIDRFDVAQPSG
jgi:hypothetical protein